MFMCSAEREWSKNKMCALIAVVRKIDRSLDSEGKYLWLGDSLIFVFECESIDMKCFSTYSGVGRRKKIHEIEEMLAKIEKIV